MDGRGPKIRLVQHLAVAAALLAGAWLAVDVLANLDEFFEADATPGGLSRALLGHYTAGGGSIGLMIGPAAAVVALAAGRLRHSPDRTGGA